MNSPLHADNVLFLLMLSQVPGVGPSRAHALIRRFGADPSLLDAGPETFSTIPGIGEQLAMKMSSCFSNSDWRMSARSLGEKQLEMLPSFQTEILTILDPHYPALLKEIYDPPTLLFVRGRLPEPQPGTIAVVGTRKATAYGRQAAETICRDLVLKGYTVISGLAYGIDMAAHRAVVECGGRTVAVVAGGVDIIYTDPAGKLWPKILEKGAIISEEWIGSEPTPGKFPRRNRIIAGVAEGTLVIESDLNGGSLITASCALEQNREVFAVPGSIFSRTSRGTNRLIQQCQAKAVFSAEDVITELRPREPSADAVEAAIQPPPAIAFSPEETAILALMHEEPLHIDLLSEKTGIGIPSLLVHLFELELRQVVLQYPGQLFLKRF
jgi:DNA processing protein